MEPLRAGVSVDAPPQRAFERAGAWPYALERFAAAAR
jgi:hypothetical protein